MKRKVSLILSIVLLYSTRNVYSGEKLLSPIVMCGPRGLNFKAPVELRIPHLASNNPEDWTFALKSSDTTDGELLRTPVY